MKKILIIEDEQAIADSLKQGLQENGYACEHAKDGAEGLVSLTQNTYSLVILDLMLPKLSGWDVIGNLRQRGDKTPVLILTALDETPDKVKGLQSGADDYLVKPFTFSELLARMEAILRRTEETSNETSGILKYEDLMVKLTSQSVERGSQSINLSSKEFQLLCYLINNAGRLVSRKEIIEHVWQIQFEYDSNIVDVAIRRLRQKIDDHFPVKLIHTVRGFGYIFEKRTHSSQD